MVSMVLDDPAACPLGGEPVCIGDAIVGQVRSAAFGYRVGRPVALGYVEAEHLAADTDTRIELDIAGTRVAGNASPRAAYDPEGRRMRTG